MISTSVTTADMHLDSPREIQNWRPFVNWLLAIPHLVVAVIYTVLVAIAATLAVIIAGFAVFFTGRWPLGLRSFVLDAGRLTLRVSAYGRLLTDTYPSLALSANKPA